MSTFTKIWFGITTYFALAFIGSYVLEEERRRSYNMGWQDGVYDAQRNDVK